MYSNPETALVLLLSLLLPLVVFMRLDGWLRRGPAGRGWLVAGGVGLVLLLEFQPTAYPLIRAAGVPAAYRVAAARPDPVLFPIPFGLLDGYREIGRMDPAELFCQTQHHKALPGAYISRVPAATFAAFAHEPVLCALLLAQQQPDSLALLPPPGTRAGAGVPGVLPGGGVRGAPAVSGAAGAPAAARRLPRAGGAGLRGAATSRVGGRTGVPGWGGRA